MGAVPFQDAKRALSGNRVMSPTSTSNRAAPEGPNSIIDEMTELIRTPGGWWYRNMSPRSTSTLSAPDAASDSAQKRPDL
jgi:hypothetical protein